MQNVLSNNNQVKFLLNTRMLYRRFLTEDVSIRKSLGTQGNSLKNPFEDCCIF